MIKIFSQISKRSKSFIRSFSFLTVYNSPFVLPKISVYFGKTKYGTPFFHPRKFRKLTKKEREIEESKRFERLSDWWKDAQGIHDVLYRETRTLQKVVKKKISLDFIGLGWKTKWSKYDYRLEHEPIFSFVFFGYQLAIRFNVEYSDYYWEAWLYYHFNTDKRKNHQRRIQQCIDEFSMTYTSYKDNKRVSTNYYYFILKQRYQSLIS